MTTNQFIVTVRIADYHHNFLASHPTKARNSFEVDWREARAEAKDTDTGGAYPVIKLLKAKGWDIVEPNTLTVSL